MTTSKGLPPAGLGPSTRRGSPASIGRARLGHGSGTYKAKASDGYTDSRSVADEIVKPAASILPMALDASMGNPRWIQHPANPTPQTLGEIHDSRTSKQPILAHRRLPGQPAPDGPRIRVGPSCPGHPRDPRSTPHYLRSVSAGPSTPVHHTGKRATGARGWSLFCANHRVPSFWRYRQTTSCQGSFRAALPPEPESRWR